MDNLLAAVAHLDNLYRAWSDVRLHVRRTAWPHLLAEMAEIDAAPLQTLRLIHRQLEQGAYQFSPNWAYAKRKSGGSRRGITVKGLRDRIVQRAILNIIFSAEPAVQRMLGDLPKILNTPTSFAGVPGRGVPEAIGLVQTKIRRGAKAFAYSDMKDFFPCVPRHDVVCLLGKNIGDQGFLQLFSKALETEVQNRDEVEAWLSLFPTGAVGVAQGSLLSTLVGNLSLHEFDARLNDDQIVTVRYLDDFLVLAPDLPAAVAAFQRAQQELARLGMCCYAPNDGSQKAAWGLIQEGFNFLGCHIHPDGISPARRSRNNLLAEIKSIIREGKKNILAFRDATKHRRTEAMYTQTLAQIDRKIRGWGDVYRFVSNRVPFSQIDAQIDRLLNQFHAWFQHYYQRADARAKRRMQGVALLADTPPAVFEDGPDSA